LIKHGKEHKNEQALQTLTNAKETFKKKGMNIESGGRKSVNRMQRKIVRKELIFSNGRDTILFKI